MTHNQKNSIRMDADKRYWRGNQNKNVVSIKKLFNVFKK